MSEVSMEHAIAERVVDKVLNLQYDKNLSHIEELKLKLYEAMETINEQNLEISKLKDVGFELRNDLIKHKSALDNLLTSLNNVSFR